MFWWFYPGRLFIADTNNNLIRYLDLKNEKVELHTLELKGVLPPAPKSRSLKRLRRRSGADTQTIVVSGGSSKEAILHLQISVPGGYHFSKVLSHSSSPPNDTLAIIVDGCSPCFQM